MKQVFTALIMTASLSTASATTCFLTKESPTQKGVYDQKVAGPVVVLEGNKNNVMILVKTDGSVHLKKNDANVPSDIASYHNAVVASVSLSEAGSYSMITGKFLVSKGILEIKPSAGLSGNTTETLSLIDFNQGIVFSCIKN